MRTDLAGLDFATFATWSRALIGHSDRFHRALYRQVVTTGRCAPAELPDWREAEASSPGVIAAITSAAAEVQMPIVVRSQQAEDPSVGLTTKIVVRLHDGLEAECVHIPMRAGGHHTVCVSSQVGCKMGCTFCHTARMGLVRQLAPHEIVGQVLAAAAHTGVAPRNVVFMGMGEPLDNIDAVAAAVRVFTDRAGLKLGWRHITISTVGRVDQFPRMVELDLHKVNLAVSLTAADDTLRSQMMPVNRTHNLAALKAALLAQPMDDDRRILVSYVLLAGVNDDAAAAEKLITWVSGLRALVNLIPFNEFAGSVYRRPSDDQVIAFRTLLDAAGLHVRMRLTKGDGVMAACGQLGNLSLRRKSPSSQSLTPGS